MAVTRDEVAKIAALAYLRFSEEELERYTGQLNRILEYVEQLNELDTELVPVTYHPAEYPNVFREDEPRQGLTVDEALQNAPQKSWQYFVVPKVIARPDSEETV